jgi:hypothetical protein
MKEKPQERGEYPEGDARSFGYHAAQASIGATDLVLLCITVDAHTGICISASNNSLTRITNLEVACAGIAERWQNIPPPPKAVL